jgi:hypothetical protein
MNEKYEVTGPVQKVEQRKPWVAGLEHLLTVLMSSFLLPEKSFRKQTT